MEEPVFMHSSSVLRKSLPEWVVYQEVFETSKMYMRGITAIEPEWLPVYAPGLCNLSPPLVEPPPRFDEDTGKMYCHVTGTFGMLCFPLFCYIWYVMFSLILEYLACYVFPYFLTFGMLCFPLFWNIWYVMFSLFLEHLVCYVFPYFGTFGMLCLKCIFNLPCLKSAIS